MKNISSRVVPCIVTLFIAGIVIIQSCERNGDAAAENRFTWNYDGITYTARVDTAYIATRSFGPVIQAGLGTRLYAPDPEIQIFLPSFNMGTYSFSAGGTNIFYYTDVMGFNYGGTGGSLIITSSSSSLLSGNFSVNLNSGKTISGDFKNVPVRP